MKLVFHYSVENFSNTYVLGHENGGDAILVIRGFSTFASSKP
jgi:hypothetical protein